MSKKIINVVAAAIEQDGKIFCAQRPEGKSLGGFWEFPGGKVEEGESLYTAIEREIKEELKCSIKAIEIIGENRHEYEKIIVNLTAIKCNLVEGEPVADEHSKLIYLNKENLESLVWAPADIPLVKKVINIK